MNHSKININNSLLLVIDVQEKLMPVIHQQEKVIKNINILIKGTHALGVPILISEQYPKGLGNTIKEIDLPKDQIIVEKTTFSCMATPQLKEKIESKKHIILVGVESHICVLKTAQELVEANFIVHLIVDAISSRTEENKFFAIERMKQDGVLIETTEMLLFQLLDMAGTNEFKTISKLIK